MENLGKLGHQDRRANEVLQDRWVHQAHLVAWEKKVLLVQLVEMARKVYEVKKAIWERDCLLYTF